jgi:hypothetical protein
VERHHARASAERRESNTATRGAGRRHARPAFSCARRRRGFCRARPVGRARAAWHLACRRNTRPCRAARRIDDLRIFWNPDKPRAGRRPRAMVGLRGAFARGGRRGDASRRRHMARRVDILARQPRPDRQLGRHRLPHPGIVYCGPRRRRSLLGSRHAGMGDGSSRRGCRRLVAGFSRSHHRGGTTRAEPAAGAAAHQPGNIRPRRRLVVGRGGPAGVCRRRCCSAASR